MVCVNNENYWKKNSICICEMGVHGNENKQYHLSHWLSHAEMPTNVRLFISRNLLCSVFIDSSKIIYWNKKKKNLFGVEKTTTNSKHIYDSFFTNKCSNKHIKYLWANMIEQMNKYCCVLLVFVDSGFMCFRCFENGKRCEFVKFWCSLYLDLYRLYMVYAAEVRLQTENGQKY